MSFFVPRAGDVFGARFFPEKRIRWALSAGFEKAEQEGEKSPGGHAWPIREM